MQGTAMTAAQAVQNQNRDDDGRYKQKTHTEVDDFTAPPVPADEAARAGLPAEFVEAVEDEFWTGDYVRDRWQRSEPSRNDRSYCIRHVIDAINTTRNTDDQIRWTPTYDQDSGDIMGDDGFLETGDGRVVKADMGDLADWDTEGWGQITSIHERVTAATTPPAPAAATVVADANGSVTVSTFPIIITSNTGRVKMAEVYATEAARDAVIIEMATERWLENRHGYATPPATVDEAYDFLDTVEPEINLYTSPEW